MNTKEQFFPCGKLCISSVQKKEVSFEDYRYVAYLAATNLGFEVIRNPEDNDSTQRSFENILMNDFPVFVLIMGEESSPMVSKEFKIALEYCLPIFVFIKTEHDKISRNSENNVRKISNSTFEYDCSKFGNSEDLYKKVYQRLKKHITENISKTSRLLKGSEAAYDINKILLSRAKRQIIIYQRTSILILGPRKGQPNETQFYKELTKWLSNRVGDVEFLHVFNWDETKEEIENRYMDYEDIRGARRNLEKLLKKDEKNNPRRLNIRRSNTNNPVSYVITDTNLVFVLPVEKERYTIEMPANIMRTSEIQILKQELYQTKYMDISEIEKIYGRIK